jgi:L-2-hydroxyglutarate oxidase LhgO
MKQDKYQILIIGAGIVGLTIARELVNRGIKDIVVLEKETSLGLHASGRNSGVIHAGMYYTPDSLKAKYCVEGNRRMKEFCQKRGLTLNEIGKVILATNPSQIEALHELKRRADSCGARAVMINGKKLSELEPNAAPCDEALFSPDTAVLRPMEVLKALEEELKQSGVTIRYGTSFKELQGQNEALTSDGAIQFETLINAAGSHGDKIAHKCGLAKEYKMLPFKGTYKKLSHNKKSLVRGNIYPVPDLRTPFLGVHLTRSADDEILIGPTAIPAFSRENYRIFEGLGWETFDILSRDLVLMFGNSEFRQVAFTEPKKYLKQFVLKEARKLVPGLRMDDLTGTDHVGIRPQLVHWPTKKLVMDFLVMRNTNSLHVLNPISPAFTTSMAFAKDIVDSLMGQGSITKQAK